MITNSNLKNRIINCCLSVIAISSFVLTGCGSVDKSGRDVHIELIEPVGVTETCVATEIRDLYDAKVISGIVCPAVEEYSFSSGVKFSRYGSMPGTEVKAGDALIYGDTADYDKQIENLEKSISEMEESNADIVEKQTKSRDDAKQEYSDASDILELWEEAEPKQEEGQSSSDFDKKYADWKKNYDIADMTVRYAYIAYQRAELTLKETTEKYELDHNFQLDKLSDLKKKRKDLILSAGTAGTVVGVDYINPGDYISKDKAIVAVADFSQKIIRTDFVNKGTINKAEDVYALIDGKRYEVNYIEISSTEYDRLFEKNGVVYSSFVIDDPENQVKSGAFAVIVIVNETRKQTLCLPKSAIATDSNGNYVYTYNGSSYEVTYLKVGMSDGLYTEILSGLQLGDLVKSAYSMKSGDNTATLTYGSISGSFSESGYLYYPDIKNINNPIKYGVVYLDEICVKQNEKVSKGQVIAKIHVASDSIEIARNERTLQRQQEYLQDLIDADKDKAEDDKVNKDAIKQTEKYIAELEELIADMKSDGNTTEIVSSIDGIITGIMNGNAGDIIVANKNIASVADETNSYIIVEDDGGKLTYGDVASVTYKDKNNNSKVAEGVVVSVNKRVLSKDLMSGYSLIQVPAEALAEMAGSTQNDYGWWSRNTYSVSVTIRSMENVILVPKKAVTESNGSTYVTVKDENGQVRRVSFIAGGSDISNYWVVDGLTEGMTVCWE